ncbi:MAG: conjugal transfer protein TraE [Clostridiaceae bacterium]
MHRKTTARTLTSRERKEIDAAVHRAHGAERKQPATAQDSIPYQRMWPDGVCRVNDTFYSKTVRFEDINYQLAQNEDKTAIFEGWCDFLNYFDASIRFQFSFHNLYGGHDALEQSIVVPPRGNDFDEIRREYTEMLQTQLAKGNNGLKKTRYITFGIEAESYRVAKQRLERIELDILHNFKQLGVSAVSLSGKERLQLMHGIFRMGGQEEAFRFDWKLLAASGLSTKDFIAPSSFEFREGRSFRTGKRFGAISFLSILAPELNDRMLADFLDMQSSLIVSMHIQSVDQNEAIKTIKRKITDLDKMKIEEQKKAVRAGYDMDIIPSDLATYGGEAKSLLKELQSRNERMFLVTFLIVNTGETRQQLENDAFQAAGIAQKYNCALVRLDFQQEQGLMSALPLAQNLVPIQRNLTTSSTAIFVPFMSQELCQREPEALYYGINPLSNNLIMVDRKLLKNPNGLILGTPGSGKSFAAKREMFIVFILTGDDMIVCDPEGEYAPLVSELHGQVIRIAPTSGERVNPMDIHANYCDGDNPIPLKINFLMSLFEIIVSPGTLTFGQKSVIEKAARTVYTHYFSDRRADNMPTLTDLHAALIEIRDANPAYRDEDADNMAKAIDPYVHGAFNLFNHRTNVDVQNRLVCFDTKEAGSQLKTLAMHVIQDHVWGRVSANRTQKRATRYYIDEFHLLLKDEITAAYSAEIWKRFRKWGGIPTAITQNVKDLLNSKQAENIFENSDFILLLNQAPGDRAILAKLLNISPHQLSYVTHSGEGEGLIVYGDTILPFLDHFNKESRLYQVMTTKPGETRH